MRATLPPGPDTLGGVPEVCDVSLSLPGLVRSFFLPVRFHHEPLALQAAVKSLGAVLRDRPPPGVKAFHTDGATSCTRNLDGYFSGGHHLPADWASPVSCLQKVRDGEEGWVVIPPLLDPRGLRGGDRGGPRCGP